MRHLLLLLLHHGGRFLDRGARLCLHAAAGLSRREDFHRATPPAWDTFFATDDKIDSGLLRLEQELADAHVRPGDRVLVVGCGSGRDLLPFARMGCPTVGLDPSRRALDAAERALRRHGLLAELHQGFFETAALTGPFDVVWFSLLVYSLIPGREGRVAALRKAVSLLSAEGRVVITVQTLPAPQVFRHVTQAMAMLSRSDWIPSPHDQFYPVAGSPYVRYEHAFAPAEAEAEAGAAGLDIVDSRNDHRDFGFLVGRRPAVGISADTADFSTDSGS